MKSKIIDNLFFAGEIINIDGKTGGFNLQSCWSTGYLAGKNAAI
jgi:predicted flavoprotein YhiN